MSRTDKIVKISIFEVVPRSHIVMMTWKVGRLGGCRFTSDQITSFKLFNDVITSIG
jgi:hypothetical protein